jgi:RNA polymerase sigma-70 factor (ECF subfamily)
VTREEEQDVIHRAMRGDGEAMALLISTHKDGLYAFMLRMSGRPHVAEDIVQEAFVRVLRNIDRFDARFRFSTWLFTIAKRLYVNAMQKLKPVYDTDIVGSARGARRDPDAPAIDTEHSAICSDAIGRALAQLSAEQREIIILFHQQDWPIARIATFMDMPEGTVKSHLHRGRKKMKAYFEEFESQRTTLAFAEVLGA